MDASCQCGKLTASVDDSADPMVVVCHCTDCQKRSGSPFGAMAYYPDSAVNLTGKASEYSRPTDSGNTYTTGFCPTCGSTLYGKASRFPGITGITVGSISNPSFATPARSVYEQSRHGWVTLPDEVPGFWQGRDGEQVR